MKEKAEQTLKEIIKIIWGIDVSVEGTINELGINLVINCDDSSKPIVIGKRGRNINLLRKIMTVWAKRNKCSVNIQKL